MKDKYLSVFDVFSDENTYDENCNMCLTGSYELYELPELCWNCYDKVMLDLLDNEWLSIDTPALG